MVLFFLCSESMSADNEEVNEDTLVFQSVYSAYSIYQERYAENSISGLMVSGHGAVDKSLLQFSIFLGVKLETIQSQSLSEKSVSVPAIDWGVSTSYGRNVFVYSEVGYDVGEALMLILLKAFPSDEREDVNVDMFISSGIGVRVKKMGVKIYAKFNSLSGYKIQDHDKIYYGIRVSYLF